jgi:hypothetical protein
LRDDRVLPVTLWTARLVVPILVAAGVILYGFPDDTDDLWAWTIAPPVTSLAIGGGYLAGAVFFARGLRDGRWHVMALGFVAAGVLTVLLLTATLLHWDRFHHGHVSFWAWLVIYVVTPVLLPAIWFRNRRHDPGPAAGEVTVPGPVAVVVGAFGAAQLVVSLVFFARPSIAIDVWPWMLTPLTARTISSFLAFIAVMLLAFLVERRWSALRLLVDSAALGLGLVLLGVARENGDLTGDTVEEVGFSVLVAGLVLALVALRVALSRATAPGERG